MRTLIYDVETNGLLRQMTRIHCGVVRDPDTKEKWRFRHNDEENTIGDMVALLEKADRLVGHNSIKFDNHAVKKIFPSFKLPRILKDTMVLARVAAPDLKDHDYRLWRQGLLPGGLIGSHKLEAWGYRLGKRKGDYAEDMKAKGLDPWAAWNIEMEDYCDLDTEVTELIWLNAMGEEVQLPEVCDALEHQIEGLCGRMENNGFPFDIEGARRLEATIRAEADGLNDKLVSKYGMRFVPDRKKKVKAAWYDPDGKMRAKELLPHDRGGFEAPDLAWCEDKSRPWWGQITIPKRSQVRKEIQYTEGAPYCKAKWIEFNPNSRTQVVERLTEEHGWIPTEFTESGAPSLDGPSLEKLSATVPIAKDIGELFFLRKMLGQIADGDNSWIKNYDEETGSIHGRTNPGGAVTGRCTHSNPNLGQVPSVMLAKYKEGEFKKKPILTEAGWGYEISADILGKKEYPLLGRAGEFGWECRSLFGVPHGWKQVGVDLKGIELRCLGALTAPFDDGELASVVVSGDPHQYNMDKTGINDRGIIKRVLYGLLYGAGDIKLGLTANPTLSLRAAEALGAELRDLLMKGLPALKKAIDKVKKDAARGYLIGLDGRRIKVRSEHSALNTRLQSDAALIAKKWLCLSEEYAIDAGMQHGWEVFDDQGKEWVGDFAILAFVHDEQQTAVAPEYAEEYAKIAVRASVDAGQFFNFACPVDADAKIGISWAECH